MNVNELARLHAVYNVFQLAIMTTAVGMDSKVNKEHRLRRQRQVNLVRLPALFTCVFACDFDLAFLLV